MGKCVYAPWSRERTSASAGRAGIAPFFVVVMAPHAFANFRTSLNLASSCNFRNCPTLDKSNHTFIVLHLMTRKKKKDFIVCLQL